MEIGTSVFNSQVLMKTPGSEQAMPWWHPKYPEVADGFQGHPPPHYTPSFFSMNECRCVSAQRLNKIRTRHRQDILLSALWREINSPREQRHSQLENTSEELFQHQKGWHLNPASAASSWSQRLLKPSCLVTCDVWRHTIGSSDETRTFNATGSRKVSA